MSVNSTSTHQLAATTNLLLANVVEQESQNTPKWNLAKIAALDYGSQFIQDVFTEINKRYNSTVGKIEVNRGKNLSDSAAQKLHDHFEKSVIKNIEKIYSYLILHRVLNEVDDATVNEILAESPEVPLEVSKMGALNNKIEQQKKQLHQETVTYLYYLNKLTHIATHKALDGGVSSNATKTS